MADLSYFAQYIINNLSQNFSENNTFYYRWEKNTDQGQNGDFTPHALRLLINAQKEYNDDSEMPELIAAEETCILTPDNTRCWWKFIMVFKTLGGYYKFTSYSVDLDVVYDSDCDTPYYSGLDDYSYDGDYYIERDSPQYICNLANSDTDFNTYYNNLPQTINITYPQRAPSWCELSSTPGWVVMPFTPWAVRQLDMTTAADWY